MRLDSPSRRQTLKILLGSAGAVVSLQLTASAAQARRQPGGLPTGGSAPATGTVVATLPKFFSASQFETVAALAETVIPADEHSPGARAARVEDYIDGRMAIADQKTRQLWIEGIAAMDAQALARYGKLFARCDATEQVAILNKAAVGEDRPTRSRSLEERFFVALKQATLEAYYTSAIGIRQVGP